MKRDLGKCSLKDCPHAFVNKKGEAILIQLLGDRWERPLAEMYLAYEPRNSFHGLPPADDGACLRWVEGMVRDALNVVAISFWDGVVGHTSLFPMDDETCELLLVVAPRFQNTGIGTQLTHCAVRLCSEIGFSRIWLSVESANLRARHVYSKCGFERLELQSAGGVDMAIDLERVRRLLQEPVSSVMNRQVECIAPNERCRSAVEVFVSRNIAALPVVDGEREVKGILCETDLMRPTDYGRMVGEIMTREVVTVDVDTPIERVVRLFHQRKIRCIPVLDEHGKLAGIVGRKDVLRHYAKRLAVLK
jgi:CBS domain-containing protein